MVVPLEAYKSVKYQKGKMSRLRRFLLATINEIGNKTKLRTIITVFFKHGSK